MILTITNVQVKMNIDFYKERKKIKLFNFKLNIILKTLLTTLFILVEKKNFQPFFI